MLTAEAERVRRFGVTPGEFERQKAALLRRLRVASRRGRQPAEPGARRRLRRRVPGGPARRRAPNPTRARPAADADGHARRVQRGRPGAPGRPGPRGAGAGARARRRRGADRGRAGGRAGRRRQRGADGLRGRDRRRAVGARRRPRPARSSTRRPTTTSARRRGRSRTAPPWSSSRRRSRPTRSCSRPPAPAARRSWTPTTSTWPATPPAPSPSRASAPSTRSRWARSSRARSSSLGRPSRTRPRGSRAVRLRPTWRRCFSWSTSTRRPRAVTRTPSRRARPDAGFLANQVATPQAAFQDTLRATLAGGDPRTPYALGVPGRPRPRRPRPLARVLPRPLLRRLGLHVRDGRRLRARPPSGRWSRPTSRRCPAAVERRRRGRSTRSRPREWSRRP